MAKKADAKDTKEKIFIAAAKLFATKGFHAASMRDIAKEADVNLALINYHFSNKDNLFAEVIQQGVKLFQELMEDHRGQNLENLLKFLMKESNNKKGYGYYLNIYMRLFLDQVAEVEAKTDIFVKGPPGIHVWREAVADAIGEGAQDRDVAIIAHILIGHFVHVSRIQFGLGGKFKKKTYVSEFMPESSDIFTDMLLELANRLVADAKTRAK